MYLTFTLIFSLVWPANMDGVESLTYSEASHLGVFKMLWI